MIESVIVLFIFALGGALDGLRDAIREYDMGFEYKTEVRSLLSKAPDWIIGNPDYYRIKLGNFINIPLDGWHICKTLAYICFAGATIWACQLSSIPCQLNWWLLIAGWAVVRPIVQNTVQWSVLYNRFTLRGW